MNTIHLPITQNYHTINGTNIVMIPIDEKEEKQIDKLKDGFIVFKRGNLEFKISHKNILCYGEIDFNNNDDLNIINKFKFTDTPLCYISRYDYETHTCKSNNKKPMWSETNNAIALALFAHGSLGKPERIVLFKNIIL